MDDALVAIWIGRARIGFGVVAVVAPRLVARVLSRGGSAGGGSAGGGSAGGGSAGGGSAGGASEGGASEGGASEGGASYGVEPMLARMAGARDIALGLGTVLAIDKGAPVRGWLEGSALADGGDAVAAVLSRKRLNRAAFRATLALSAGSAIACGLLARQLDPAPPAHPHQPEAVVTGHPE